MSKKHTESVVSLPIYEQWKNNKNKSIWKDSIFECFNSINSPKSKGSQGEKLVKQFMEKQGHKIEGRITSSKRKSSDYDCIIDGMFVEVKTSSTWGDVLDNFTWQQIRNQDYDRIVFVAINPNDVTFYWATKDDLKEHIFGRDEYRQHAGKDGKQELYWIQGVKNMPWFRDIKDF